MTLVLLLVWSDRWSVPFRRTRRVGLESRALILTGSDNKAMQNQWLELCRAAGIDPQEVKLIYERYDAYRKFTEAGTGSAVPLAQWFRFYHLEKSSEGLQAGAPTEGCSADGDAVNNDCLRRPGEFFEVLEAYDAVGKQGV